MIDSTMATGDTVPVKGKMYRLRNYDNPLYYMDTNNGTTVHVKTSSKNIVYDPNQIFYTVDIVNSSYRFRSQKLLYDLMRYSNTHVIVASSAYISGKYWYADVYDETLGTVNLINTEPVSNYSYPVYNLPNSRIILATTNSSGAEWYIEPAYSLGEVVSVITNQYINDSSLNSYRRQNAPTAYSGYKAQCTYYALQRA